MLSTDPLRRLRWWSSPLALLAMLLMASCLHHTSSQIQAVCTGANVGKRLVLVLDSVTPAADGNLMRLKGQRFDITVSLANPPSSARCEDRSGAATVTVDELPDELARATAPKRGGQWRVDGTRVAVDLNPGVLTRNLQLYLPLDGSPGEWRLATLTGTVARGRLLGQR
jgi:hypothetical protein